MSLTKKLNQNLFNIILLFFFTISNGFADNKIVGKAKVIDGDTIKIKNINIRFGGSDAPESYFKGKTQTCLSIITNEKTFCGKESKMVLKNKISNNLVTCIPENKKDKFNRVIAECYVNSESLSSFMVRSGYAFDFKKYSKGKFKIEEIEAKENNAGLWRTKFDYPWIWRKNNK